ncbi:MAG: transketolase [Elusimicrobia bacterium]|nr:transketolase [Elusimicrobiota bacterium]
MEDVEQLCVDAIRFMAVDAVEKAKSGHPGMPLGAAPMAFVLWDRFLRHDPADPGWPDRDRFVLSAGHASAMLYALLNLHGYDLPLSELQRFRQWGSKTPGHPEHGDTPGVEATTGPLGQGFAMAVGMALAERSLAAGFNRPGFQVVGHRTFVLCSDGDMMEGVCSEAASLAGRLGLAGLVCLYDSNRVSLEGPTDLSFNEDVARRFEAYRWRVERVADGNDLEAVAAALASANREAGRPTLIVVSTHIGFGSPKQDSFESHGEPLGPEGVKSAKTKLGWPLEPAFHVPEEARRRFADAARRGADISRRWRALFKEYAARHPDLAARFERAMKAELPEGWAAGVPSFSAEQGPLATRDASGKVLNALACVVPELMGGSADLSPSTKTRLAGAGDVTEAATEGRNIHFGVREHAMAAAVNGMALHGGVRPFGATFLVFSDYMRPAIRLSALMRCRSLFVFTHDSVGLGEDGPTHQPVEHLMSLRAVPGLTVLRPADANETAAAWRVALLRRGPVALVLTRQKLPVLDPARYPIADGVPAGAYVLAEPEGGKPDVALLASGSEVSLVLAAAGVLAGRGVAARVVSMPSWELFREQSAAYREQVLSPGIPRLAVEAGVSLGWSEFVGDTGRVIGLDRFGASAPGEAALERLGFGVENVASAALGLVRPGRP